VIGTSAQVSPACDIPRIAKESGAAIVEINPEPTRLTSSITDIHLPWGGSEILAWMVDLVRRGSGVSPSGEG